MLTWWQRLLVWLGISEPGTRKEQVEDWIETNARQVDDFMARQMIRKETRGHYFQRTKGWSRPTDDQTLPDEPNDFEPLVVGRAWVTTGVDVWEAPVRRETTERGFTLNFFVTELDATNWVLRIDSKEGALGWSSTDSQLVEQARFR